MDAGVRLEPVDGIYQKICILKCSTDRIKTIRQRLQAGHGIPRHGQDGDLMLLRQQGAHHVGADKTGSAGYKYFHRSATQFG